MKKTFARIAVLAVCMLLAHSAAAHKDSVAVYSNDATPQPYVIIGKLSFEKGSNIGTCEARLGKFAAKKYNADAILNYKLTEAHLCEGVAVRWAKEGEEGVSRITEETPVPVVEGKKVTFRWF